MKGSAQNASIGSDKALVTQQVVKMLASKIFGQMQDEGFQPRDIISVSSQLIDLVTTELQKDELQKT